MLMELQLTNNPKTMLKIIEACYNHKHNQLFLCNALKIPFFPGPITLNSIPPSFARYRDQLVNLLKYLRKVKEYYFCWAIFYDGQLQMLNVKMFTRWETDCFDYFNLEEDLIGILIGKECPKKERIFSVIGSNKMNLSSKTTKETIF